MGLYLLIFMVGFVLIVYWAWRNDGVPTDGQTRGLFRMRSLVQPESAPPDEPMRHDSVQRGGQARRDLAKQNPAELPNEV